MLHPVTLEPLDDLPYKHSSESIIKLIFTECGEYMAYSVNVNNSHFRCFHYCYKYIFLTSVFQLYKVHNIKCKVLVFTCLKCNK